MAFFTIGKIIKPFGVLGEVKVDFFVNEMDDLQAFSAFYIEDKRSPNGRKEIRFENLREGGDRMIARIDAIPDRNAAELFRDRDILVDEAELPETQADEFYIRDLLDANVFFEGAPYGTVMNVFGIGNRTFLLVKIRPVRKLRFLSRTNT